MSQFLRHTRCVIIAVSLIAVANVIAGTVIWQQGCRQISFKSDTTIANNHPGACLDWCETHKINTNYIALMDTFCTCLETNTGHPISRCQADTCKGNTAHYCGNKDKNRASFYQIEQRITIDDTSCVMFSCSNPSLMFGECSLNHTFASYKKIRRDCLTSRVNNSWNISFHNFDSPEDQWYNNDTGNSICRSSSPICQYLQQSVFWLGGFGKYAPVANNKTTVNTTEQPVLTTNYTIDHSESTTQTITIACSVSVCTAVLLSIIVAILVRRWCIKKKQIAVKDECNKKPNNILREDNSAEKPVTETVIETSHGTETNDTTVCHMLVSKPPAHILNSEAKISDMIHSNEKRKVQPIEMSTIESIRNFSTDNDNTPQVKTINVETRLNAIKENVLPNCIPEVHPSTSTLFDYFNPYVNSNNNKNRKRKHKKKKKKQHSKNELLASLDNTDTIPEGTEQYMTQEHMAYTTVDVECSTFNEDSSSRMNQKHKHKKKKRKKHEEHETKNTQV